MPDCVPSSRRTSRAVAAIALLSLALSACGDDGPTPLVNDSTWNVPRELRIDEFELTEWSGDGFAATDLAFLPDGRSLLITKGGWGGPGIGQVVLLDRHGGTEQVVLDIPVCTDAERGLLGIAVDPFFDTNQRFYVYFTRATSDCAVYSSEPEAGVEPVTNRLSSFALTAHGVDPASEIVILDGIDAGQSSHNGGGLSFLPDNTLLVGVGEAMTGASRDLDVPLGKILRLDVSKAGWGVVDNPFFDHEAPTAIRSLIYASGLRNPFRVAGDPYSPLIAVADVGTDVYEEVNLLVPGTDYGFPEVEGPYSDNESAEPDLWYTHDNGCNSVIGGTWVRPGWLDSGHPSAYAFSDFGCGGVFLATFHRGEAVRVYQIAPQIDHALARVIVGPDDALYLVGVGPGDSKVLRLSKTT